jgi:signal transduction histidine kinase/ligand-binding sensor domain-containing protein
LKKILAIFLFFSLGFCNAQDHGFFNQVWLEQGLSQSSIISIIQDKQGFIWFATQDGLNRYDGRNIDHFNYRPFDKRSISGDDIYSICENDNVLYVLNDKGLDKIDLSDLKISSLKLSGTENRQNIFFRSWMFGGKLYLQSRDGLAEAIFKDEGTYEAKFFEFKDSSGTKGLAINGVCAEDGMVFAATSHGVFYRNEGEADFKKIKVESQKNDRAHDFISSIASNKKQLYYTSGEYLYKRDIVTGKTVSLKLNSFNAINSIMVDDQKKVWMGTSTRGLFLASEKGKDSLVLEKTFTKNNTRFSLQSNEITFLYQNPKSKGGVVWVGTRDAGAFKYSYYKNSFSIPTFNIPLADPNFFAVVKDKDGIIWTGSNSGILQIDRKNHSSYFIELGDNIKRVGRPVEALCDDGENMWAGYGNSLYLIDRKNKKLTVKASPIVEGLNNQISKVIALNKEQLLLCGSRGIIIYNKNGGAEKPISTAEVNGQKISIEAISSFLLDSAGNKWVGCNAGLICLKKDGNNIHIQHNNNDSNTILSNRIMDIKEMSDGSVILATTKGLSIVRDFGERITNIYSAGNLQNNFIYGLLKDNSGRYWMSTNFGISVYDPANGKFKTYTASDGLCINEFNSSGFFKADDGELLFAGLGALVSIYPSKQVVSTSVSDIVLRGTKIENFTGQVKEGQQLSLSYWQNNLQFEFSVPDYTGEKNISMYYRFRNKDTVFIKVNPSQLFSLNFINIAPGKYDLEVIAVNNEGARSTPFKLKFTIGDPFWSTWWFYALLILLTVAVSWAIYRSRLQRKISYIQQIEQIRKDESEKVRKAAALDLHDEFGNGLTRISMLIEMIKLQISGENNETKKLLDVISQNSNRLYLGTKDFIWSINPGKDNMYEIAIRIKDYADEIFYGTNITFELTGLDDNLRDIKQPPTAGRNIAMIFKESLSNILKHAKASKVKLSIEQEGSDIKLSLEDDGIGFEIKDNKNSFGLTNIQQRAARSSGKLLVTSGSGKGTRVELVINKKSKENDSSS